MDLQEIKDRVKNIDYLQDDCEGAHMREDVLYTDFITHVAKTSKGKLTEMAKEVLKTQDMGFEGWYA